MNHAEKTAYFTAQYNTRADAQLAEATLARWTQQGAQARRTSACVLNLPFDADNQTGRACLDFFPTAKAGAPLLIFIHGGWWRFLSKSDFSWVAKSFTAAGFNVALTDYDLCPTVSVQTIVEQQLRAVAYLHRNAQALEFDASRIHVAGHSAGGHLAAMMCAANWPLYGADLPVKMFRSATVISGLFDLEPLSFVAAAQADLKLTATDFTKLSPLSYAPSSVPSLVFAGGLESDEFKRQSGLLLRHWDKTAKPYPAEGLTHFTVVDDWANPQGALHAAALRMMQAR